MTTAHRLSPRESRGDTPGDSPRMSSHVRADARPALTLTLTMGRSNPPSLPAITKAGPR